MDIFRCQDNNMLSCLCMIVQWTCILSFSKTALSQKGMTCVYLVVTSALTYFYRHKYGLVLLVHSKSIIPKWKHVVDPELHKIADDFVTWQLHEFPNAKDTPHMHLESFRMDDINHRVVRALSVLHTQRVLFFNNQLQNVAVTPYHGRCLHKSATRGRDVLY